MNDQVRASALFQAYQPTRPRNSFDFDAAPPSCEAEWRPCEYNVREPEEALSIEEFSVPMYNNPPSTSDMQEEEEDANDQIQHLLEFLEGFNDENHELFEKAFLKLIEEIPSETLISQGLYDALIQVLTKRCNFLLVGELGNVEANVGMKGEASLTKDRGSLKLNLSRGLSAELSLKLQRFKVKTPDIYEVEVAEGHKN